MQSPDSTSSLARRRLRNWISIGALGVFVAAGVVAYPFLLSALLPRIGVRGVAIALSCTAVLLVALRGRRWMVASRLGAAPAVGIPLLLAAAAFSGDTVYLKLVPSVVYLTLASVFYASLRSEDSLVERMARFLVPEAPDFIRSYCRKVTSLWAAFFTLCALAIVFLAIAGTRSDWSFFTGKLIYALMVAASLLEFLVRKTWFRYYFHGGWFDRLWARLFPPENTPEGRRSMQHISQYWREHNG